MITVLLIILLVLSIAIDGYILYEKHYKKKPSLKVMKCGPGATVPKYASEEAAGFDLYAAHDITLNPGDRGLVKTGLKFDIPNGYEVQIRPRSGLALKFGVTVLNTPGTIDSDYLGEIGVVLINHDHIKAFKVQEGDRIAQAVLAKVERLPISEVFSIDKETDRGTGGFGSTGVK